MARYLSCTLSCTESSAMCASGDCCLACCHACSMESAKAEEDAIRLVSTHAVRKPLFMLASQHAVIHYAVFFGYAF
ncbi:Uncharacterised protein [Vibrio cholerae]|uniref:Uncharacterized protein n=1 Tax=Vibrio cholerae TaxID=666 RepID=A0A655QPD1_VIBCL|nr:Uncharacterised protein [Vibrio cholerae]